MEKNYIGIDLGGTKMLVVCQHNGRLLTKRYKTGKEILFKQIVDNYLSFLREYDITPDALTVAIPGLVNGDRVIDCDVLPCLKGITNKEF